MSGLVIVGSLCSVFVGWVGLLTLKEYRELRKQRDEILAKLEAQRKHDEKAMEFYMQVSKDGLREYRDFFTENDSTSPHKTKKPFE
ncbi:hypothetical protein [Helicobacter labetoulli]|uniref:hypothetical protein n=1 Tax=Helicobacter labetoulli TaxID=2315333 RepID=UPI000EF69334|nr:hypothetical protein [Helicobacter labetoulli]